LSGIYDHEQTLTQGVHEVISTPSWLRRVVDPGHFVTVGKFDVPGLSPGRTVTAYIPSDHVRDESRGALYLFDGQNVFGDQHSFAGGWFAHDAIDSIGRRGRNIPILVGIDHGGESRLDELSPWSMRMGGGKLDLLLDWVTSQLVPQLQKEFGLKKGPVGSVVGGSSLGGLAALYAHFRDAETFGGALCLSPSLWLANQEIFKFVRNHKNPHISRIYLDCGGQEAGGRMLTIAERMAHELERRGYTSAQLLWRPDVNAGHSERAWRRRLPKAFRFMFKA
jgi:predicted alpha/beta superfamily hydrolase